MALTRSLHRIDREVEKRVLTGFIVSDKVIQKLNSYLQPQFFELEVSKTIVYWILDHYNSYKRALKSDIQQVFIKEKTKLTHETATNIREFLQSISAEYKHSETINDDFLLDQAKHFLRLQSARKACADTLSFIDSDEIDKAEECMQRAKKVSTDIDYKWESPLDDPDFLQRVYEEKEHPLFEMKGKLNQLVGPLRRGWLMGIMGFMKRGKTWRLQDIMLDGILSKCNTAYISLEMEGTQMGERMFQHFGAFSKEDGTIAIPCFDCCANIDDSCQKRFRLGRGKRPDEFNLNDKYVSCDECRRRPGQDQDFMMSVWKKAEKHESVNTLRVKKKIDKLRKQIGQNRLRLIGFPPYSATLTDIENKLDELNIEGKFIPDIIIIDYADIIQTEEHRADKRDQIDIIWKRLKRMSMERHCLVVTASQSNRESAKKAIMDETNTAEDIRKIAHVEIMMTIDQLEVEKRMGVVRYGVMAHRWKDFYLSRQVLALQQLELGQPYIDGEILNVNKEYFKSLTKSVASNEEEGAGE